jgi:hypothetical protein
MGAKKKCCVHAVLVAMLALPLWSVPSDAQQLGSVFGGGNNALAGVLLCNGFTTYRVDDLGVIFGFMLPIRTGRLDIHYNTRVGLNGVTDILYSSRPSLDDRQYYRNLGHYVSVLNEVLIGKRIDLSKRTYIRPMFGLGFLLHLLYGNEGPGFAYGTFQIGVTAQAMYVLKHVEAGTMLSFQYIPYDGYLDPSSVQYVSAALVLSR